MFKLKLKTFFLITIIVFCFGFVNFKPASAQFITSDIPSATFTALTKIWDALKAAYKKSGSVIFQQTLSKALNKIAIDSATWIASGDAGQTPLVNLKEFGTYLGDIADEAAGEFVERSVNAWSQAYVDEQNAVLAGCDGELIECQESCAWLYFIPKSEKLYNCEDKCFKTISKCVDRCKGDKECEKICDDTGSLCVDNCYLTYRFRDVEIPNEANECLNECSQLQLKCVQETSESGGGKIKRQINICQPSSPMGFQVKLQISLGLVEHVRPRAPNCTASDMLRSWHEAGKKLDFTNFDDKEWSRNLTRIFHPTNNELGIAIISSSDMTDVMDKKTDIAKLNIDQDGRWLDVRNIAGGVKKTAEQTKGEKEASEKMLHENIGKMTTEPFIDAANVFLNTLALKYYQRAMQNLPKLFSGGQDKGSAGSGSGSDILTNPDADPGLVFTNIDYGEGDSLRERIAKIISPQYSSLDDYNILSKLVVCPDPNNPGPTDCVIDESLMGAILAKKTVIEAVSDGDLKGNWTFTLDDSKKSAYKLRSLMILRQNRILPLAWEVAAKRMAEDGHQATLMDLISCFSGEDDYKTYSQGFKANNVAWCRGLIDPHWVLKAPLSYCSKQGIGSYILDKTIVPGQSAIGNTPAVPSSLEITRDNNYCADYKTCLKKGADGDCLFYGYCNEEKRIWTFGEASCEPVYNTCQSFTAPNGTRLNYLTNTLDFSCNQEDVGCFAYLLRGELINSRINWDEDFVYHFNNNLSNCSSNAEGCDELIRVQAGWGANLIKVSDLSAYDDNYDLMAISSDFAVYTTNAGTTKKAEIITVDDEKLINLVAGENGATSSISLFSNNARPLTPGPVPIIEGFAYTFSADVYINSDDTKVQLVLGPWANNYSETRKKASWQKLSRTFYIDETQAETINDLSFQVVGIGTSTEAVVNFNLKNLKLEVASWDTNFSIYGVNKTYQKLIPPYLANACYEDAFSGTKDYRLKSDAPAICYNFTRQCNKDEVGCQLFRSQDDGFSVAAKVATTDYCWGECQGYDMYVAQASQFHDASVENIIPNNSVFCQSSEVGCTEFTNLENIRAGGEQKEYFSKLRRCIKENSDCADFYTWEGSDESGYQLKALRLKKDGENPALIGSDLTCSEEIYFKLPNDPEYNPDCRQVYNKAGKISYVSLFNTIVCSDNCQTYRMSERNIDTNINEIDCISATNNLHWDSDLKLCYSCKNGGLWSDEQNACIYQGLPSESVFCSASANGCREYNGKLGSNVRLIMASDFSNGVDSWEIGQCNGKAHIATTSLESTTNNGQSLKYELSMIQDCPATTAMNWSPVKKALAAQEGNGIKLPLSYSLQNNKAYSLRILAKAGPEDVLVSFSIESSSSTKTLFNPEELNIKYDGQWHIYDLYLPFLEHEVDENTALVIRADHAFYIDSLILNEVNDKYHLIRNSSVIPDICYYDVLDNYRGADYNLGCSAWTGQANTTHYLRQFSSLCNESSAGCQLMIDTHNYSNWDSLKIEDDEGNLIISTPADSFIYAVYNPDKACSATNKGCSRMAQISGQGVNRSLAEVFKNNNPDNYNEAICSAEAVGCQQFNSGAASYYFKDPGFNTCVYRHPNDPEDTSGRNWYKSEVKRCDLNKDAVIDGAERFGRVCLSDNDCAEEITCIADKNDYPCSVSYLKTIGLGDRVPTPDISVGLCETKAAGCTEYIDPYSQHVSNLVFNPSYLNDGEGWSNDGKQDVIILPNTLYQFSSDFSGPVLSANSSLDVLQDYDALEDFNSFKTINTDLEISTDTQVIIFNSRANLSVEIDNKETDSYITLKPVILDYQLKQNLDKSTCNGIVNTNNGCVLFNERDILGKNYNSFSVNPFDSQKNKAPSNCQNGDLNCLANTLIKVQPDRTCARWLDCLSYVDDPETGERICYDLGECTSLDEYGNCSNFISFVDKNKDPLISNADFGINPNASGYSTADRYYIGEMKEVGVNTNVHFDFETSLSLSCFRNCQFDKNIIEDSIVDSPEKSEVDYPAQGKKFLKLDTKKIIRPHSANMTFKLIKDQDYYLHFLLNTSQSGQSAKIEIKNSDDSEKITLLAQANEGWTRVVRRFEVSTSDEYQMYLSSEDQGSYIYFDDIHIEPVLQVGPSEYIAKDCRLFPETSSFACRSAQDNVIKNGLEGYCLERDPLNNVCLMWYPVDQISSSQLSYGKSLGYQGKAPLYYCSEANANFLLMEKRKSTFKKSYEMGEAAPTDDCSLSYYCDGHEAGYNYITVREVKKDSKVVNEFCVPRLETVIKPDTHYLIADNFSFPNSHGVCSKLTSEQIGNLDYSGNNVLRGEDIEPGFYNLWIETDGLAYVGGADLQSGGEALNEYKFHDPPIAVYDLDNPPQSELSLKFIDHPEESKIYDLTCNSFVELVDSFGENKAWVNRVSSLAEAYKTPQYMEDKVASSNFYKTLPELGNCKNKITSTPNCSLYQDYLCNSDPSCYYCGENKWFKDCALETPCDPEICAEKKDDGCRPLNAANPIPPGCVSDSNAYCHYDSSAITKCSNYNNNKVACEGEAECEWDIFNINLETFDRYGRLREDVPYGAAILPDNFNFYSSNIIPFRNQYSKRNNVEVLAGRPYGCQGEGCGNIGQCSLNPNVFCIYYDSDDYNFNKYKLETYNYINASSCAKGGYGVCTPLWYGHYNQLNADSDSFFVNPLSSIFLKSYGALIYDPNNRAYKETDVPEYSFMPNIDLSVEGSGGLATCTPNFRKDSPNAWCAVYPQLENLRLEDLAGTEVTLTNGNFTINEAGIYLLSFTSQIDEEQQPLRNIEINWGDGYLQNVYNQDSRPLASRPHQFYHYFNERNYSLKLKIVDNWGYYDIIP